MYHSLTPLPLFKETEVFKVGFLGGGEGGRRKTEGDSFIGVVKHVNILAILKPVIVPCTELNTNSVLAHNKSLKSGGTSLVLSLSSSLFLLSSFSLFEWLPDFLLYHFWLMAWEPTCAFVTSVGRCQLLHQW